MTNKKKFMAFWEEDDEEAFAKVFPGYPTPVHMPRDINENYDVIDEEFGAGTTDVADARGPAHKFNHVERLSDFMDRYVPHWREMTPVQRRIELDDLADEMKFDYNFTSEDARHRRGTETGPGAWEPVEIENSLDFEPVKRGMVISNNNEKFHTIHYYPEGTATWTEWDNDLSPEQEELTSIINGYIDGMTSYGRRQEQVVNRYPQILIWANDSASWYIPMMPTYHIVGWDGTDQRLKIGDYVSLDANEILVYGSKKMLEPILPWLNPLPLYGASYEAKQRGVYDFGTHIRAIDPNIDWDDKLAKWDEKYPEPQKIGHSGDPEITKRQMHQTLEARQDLYDSGFRNSPGTRQYLTGSDDSSQLYATAIDEEPIVDFLDRYLSDWRDLDPTERTIEIRQFPFTIDGYGTLPFLGDDTSVVLEGVKLHLPINGMQSMDQTVYTVRYYPRGTAAFADSPVILDMDKVTEVSKLQLDNNSRHYWVNPEGIIYELGELPHYKNDDDTWEPPTIYNHYQVITGNPLSEGWIRITYYPESLAMESYNNDIVKDFIFKNEYLSQWRGSLYINGGNYRSIRRFLNEARWDEPREAMHGRLTGEPMLRELGYVSDDDRAIITDRYPYRRSATPGDLAHPEHAEPLSDFLDRYIPNWQQMPAINLAEEIDDLHKQFNFVLQSQGEGEEWETAIDYMTDEEKYQPINPEMLEYLTVRYYPAGTAAFEQDPSILSTMDNVDLQDSIEWMRKNFHPSANAEEKELLRKYLLERSKRWQRSANWDEPLEQPRMEPHPETGNYGAHRQLGAADDLQSMTGNRFVRMRTGDAFQHYEPLEGFLDRYIEDWQSLDIGSLRRRMKALYDHDFHYTVSGNMETMPNHDPNNEEQHSLDEFFPPSDMYPDPYETVLEAQATIGGASIADGYDVSYYDRGTAAFNDPVFDITPEQYASIVAGKDTQKLKHHLSELKSYRDNELVPGVDGLNEERIEIIERELLNRQSGYANFKSPKPIALTGTHIRTFRLQTSRDRIAPIDFWSLDSSPTNIALLVATADDWEVQAADLRDDHGARTDQSRRAQFASDAAFVAAKLLSGDGCCVILGYNKNTNEVVGISVYHTWQDGSANISLVSTSPNNQPDSTSLEKVRGVGTAMVCLMAQIFKHENIKKICLKPLDEEAKHFWQHRGFTDYEGMLCIINDSEKLMRACLMPECPDTGEHCSIGEFEVTSQVMKRSRRL